jgi:hypothetical protein
MRVLMTNVGADVVDAAAFADPYDQRGRIEERSSASSTACAWKASRGCRSPVLIDVAAKIPPTTSPRRCA